MTDTSNNDADTFVILDNRSALYRHWFLLFLILCLAPAAQVAMGEPLNLFQKITLILFVAAIPVTRLWPRITIAKLDRKGVHFRKRSSLPWHQVESVELSRARRLSWIYRFYWGSDAMIRFNAKPSFPLEKARPLDRWRRSIWDGHRVLLQMQADPMLDNVADKVEELSGITVQRNRDST